MQRKRTAPNGRWEWEVFLFFICLTDSTDNCPNLLHVRKILLLQKGGKKCKSLKEKWKQHLCSCSSSSRSSSKDKHEIKKMHKENERKMKNLYFIVILWYLKWKRVLNLFGRNEKLLFWLKLNQTTFYISFFYFLFSSRTSCRDVECQSAGRGDRPKPMWSLGLIQISYACMSVFMCLEGLKKLFKASYSV